MANSEYRLKLRYRLMFYAGGFVFATVSYMAGLWAYGLESASWGDTEFYRRFLRDLFGAFERHTITFCVWQFVCAGIFIMVGRLLNREVYYRRMAEERANVDGLTDIYNHRWFQERLVAETERASRYGRTLSLIMLDVDDFKAFNDTWGHQEGDKLLRWFARMCARSIRSMDFLARYGGEEFVVVLPETESEEALEVAERIRKTTETGSQAAFGRNKFATVSAGVASFPTHARTRHSLILCADTALYHAKQQGKNRCLIYREDYRKSYRVTEGHVRPLLCDDDLEAMEALAAAADARDSHTRGHSAEVTRMSVALGEKLHFSAEEMNNLRVAALLHDIGKIMTPQEVLEKSGPLAADEWKQVANHAGLGSRLLKRVQQMGSILPAVKHHHERYDGKGYPGGLAGGNIPLLARIIAIADAYEAMTSERSYRKALTPGEAIAELRNCSGTQFDPALVELFIQTAEQEQHEAA